MSITHFYQHSLLPDLELRYSDNNDGCYVLHTHDEYSLGLVLGGATRYQIRQRHYVIDADETMLIAPNTPHACNHLAKSGGQWRYLMLYITAEYWQQLCAEFASPVSDGSPIQDAELFHSLLVLHQEWQQQPEDILTIETMWLQCFQRLCEISSRLNANSDKTCDKTTLQEAIEWLQAHLHTTFTLSDWAEALNISRAQLLRIFRKQLYMSPHQYCLNQRVQHAKPLLKQGETLSNIAYQLGFADQAHFQRTFKRYTAITPRQYQKNR